MTNKVNSTMDRCTTDKRFSGLVLSKKVERTATLVKKAYGGLDFEADRDRVNKTRQSMNNYLIGFDRHIVSRGIAKNSRAVNNKQKAIVKEYGLNKTP